MSGNPVSNQSDDPTKTQITADTPAAGKDVDPAVLPTTACELLPELYEELRKLATFRMSEETGTQTLQPTALVHEAWLRLTHSDRLHWQNRAHFFSAAAEAMRRILIDRARAKHALKRNAGVERVALERIDMADTTDEETLLRISGALDKLKVVDPECAELIKLRFFVGLNYEESAQALGISERTAKRLWMFGRSWLFRELSCHDST
jgi:RNA polymerase sigma factor (TIGR02999 family)